MVSAPAEARARALRQRVRSRPASARAAGWAHWLAQGLAKAMHHQEADHRPQEGLRVREANQHREVRPMTAEHPHPEDLRPWVDHLPPGRLRPEDRSPRHQALLKPAHSERHQDLPQPIRSPLQVCRRRAV